LGDFADRLISIARRPIQHPIEYQSQTCAHLHSLLPIPLQRCLIEQFLRFFARQQDDRRYS
jgi:hypothetical protein